MQRDAGPNRSKNNEGNLAAVLLGWMAKRTAPAARTTDKKNEPEGM
jgi:hypothetical protein